MLEETVQERSSDSASILEKELGSLNADRIQKASDLKPREENREAATCLT